MFARTQTYQRTHINIFLTATLLFLVAWYVYLVAATVVHAAYVKELARRIGETNSAVAQLEHAYLQAAAKLSAADAVALGLVPVADKYYGESTVVVGLTR